MAKNESGMLKELRDRVDLLDDKIENGRISAHIRADFCWKKVVHMENIQLKDIKQKAKVKWVMQGDD